MSTIAELLIKLGMDDGGLDKGMSSSQSKLKSWGESLRSVGTKLTAGVTLPLVGAGLAAINWASDQQEAANKVDVVFGKSAKEVQKWAKSNKGSLLLSSAAAMEAAGTYGNLFTSMGMGQDEAADLSMELVELAQDLSSFNNVPTDQALIALRAALVGEYEPMRALGVQLSQATVEQKALEMGIWDGNGALDAQARILATNALIMEQTTNAQGDAARTATGFANQTRILRANLEDLGASIGERLLPVANRFLSFLIDLVDRMQGLDPFWQNVILGFAGIAAAIGPALLMLGFMLPALGALIPVFAALVSPIGLVAIALAALVAVGIYAWVNDLWGVRDAVDNLRDSLASFRPVADDFIDVWQALRDGDYDEAVYELRDAVVGLGAAIAALSADVFSQIADGLRSMSESAGTLGPALDTLARSTDTIAQGFNFLSGALNQFLAGDYSGGILTLANAFADLVVGAQQSQTAVVQAVAGIIQSLGQWILSATNARTVLQEWSNGILLIFSTLSSMILQSLQTLGSGVSARFSQMASDARAKASELASSVTTQFGTLSASVLTHVTNIANNVKNQFTNAKTNATSAVTSLVSDVTSQFITLSFSIYTHVTNIANNIKTGFDTAKSYAATAMSGLASTVISTLIGLVGSAYSMAQSIGGAIGSGLVSGIQSMIGSVISAAQGLVDAAMGILSNIPGFSPIEHVGQYYGAKLSGGFAEGIASAEKMVSGASSSVVDAAIRPFDVGVPGAADSFDRSAAPVYNVQVITLEPSRWKEFLDNAMAGGEFARGFGSELGLYTGTP